LNPPNYNPANYSISNIIIANGLPSGNAGGGAGLQKRGRTVRNQWQNYPGKLTMFEGRAIEIIAVEE
jgi:hypothetical protein